MKNISFFLVLFFFLGEGRQVFSQGREESNREKTELLPPLRPGKDSRSFSLKLEQLFRAKLDAQKNQDIITEARINLSLAKLTWEADLQDQGLNFFENAAEQFQKAGLYDSLPDLYLQLADKYESLGEINSAIRSCSRGLNVLDRLKGSQQEPQARKNIRNARYDGIRRKILLRLNNYADPRGETEKVLKINQELLEILGNADRNSKEYSKVTNNIGYAWLAKKEAVKAEEYFRKAIQLEEVRKDGKNITSLVEFQINLARALILQNRYREAEKELKTALGICQENRLTPLESSIHCFLSKIELHKDDLMAAYRSSSNALQLARKVNNAEKNHYLEQALENHAGILKRSGAYAEAFSIMGELKELKDSELRIQKEKDRNEKVRKESARELEKSFGNIQEVFQKYLEEVRSMEEFKEKEQIKERNLLNLRIQDSLKKTILQDSIRASMAEMDALLARASLEKEMEDVRHSRAMTEQKLRDKVRLDSLAKLNQDAQQKRRLSELERIATVREREKLLAIAIATGIFLLVAIYFAIDSKRKNRRLKESQLQIEAANKALGSLNRQLTGKNKSITDSIQYARGIQSAILPGENRWKEVFPDSFVLFMPKDIVSGDFYFLSGIGNKHVMAFADCTGHGVPGALMSIIGHNLLVSAVDLHGITRPAEILKFMDQGLRNTLQQDGHENQDGMEIGICTFDTSDGSLEFAGSRRPLYGLGPEGFFEWKGDRHYLGSGKTSYEAFHSYQCPLEQISEIWLSSDGYPDQFGGPDSKRFHSGKLKQTLLSLAGLPAEEQKAALSGLFREWKGGHSQLDDVMVIGIRPQSIRRG